MDTPELRARRSLSDEVEKISDLINRDSRTYVEVDKVKSGDDFPYGKKTEQSAKFNYMYLTEVSNAMEMLGDALKAFTEAEHLQEIANEIAMREQWCKVVSRRSSKDQIVENKKSSMLHIQPKG